MTFRASLLAAVAVFATVALVIGSDPTLEGQAARGKAALMNPAEAKEQAPAAFKINFDSSAGLFVVEMHRDWAPFGVDRVYNLVKRGFYDECRFFRVIPDYIVQFGVSGEPEIHNVWRLARIPDDPANKPRPLGGPSSTGQSNKKSYLAFVQPAGVDRRTTQLLINLVDNPGLDRQGVAPLGQVVSGMDVVEKIHSGYGELTPTGKGPELNRLFAEGNAYLAKEFPRMDYIKTATIVP